MRYNASTIHILMPEPSSKAYISPKYRFTGLQRDQKLRKTCPLFICVSVFSQLVHDLSSNLKSMPLAMKIHFLKAHSGWIWSSDEGLKNHMWPRNHRLQPPDLRERAHGRSQVFCITLHNFMLSNQNNIFPFSYNAWNNVKNPLWVFFPFKLT